MTTAAVLDAAAWSMRKVALEIGTSSPLRYCNGRLPALVSSTLYHKRPITWQEFSSGPERRGLSLRIWDGDLELAASDRIEDFRRKTMTLLLLGRQRAGEPWVTLRTYHLGIQGLDWADGWMTLTCSTMSGRKAHGGCPVFGPECWLAQRGFRNNPRCPATSGTTCDGRWESCQTYGGTAGFQGLRRAPEEGETIALGTAGAGMQTIGWERPERPWQREGGISRPSGRMIPIGWEDRHDNPTNPYANNVDRGEGGIRRGARM